MMRIILVILLFSYGNVKADGITLPVLPTVPEAAPAPKSDDVLPIAPTRYDDQADAPATVFSSVNKDDPWEKFERGENLRENNREDHSKGSIHTENIAKSKNVKDKNKRDVASVGKGKKTSKKKISKNTTAHNKSSLKKGKNEKHASLRKISGKTKKRTPSSKLPPKKKSVGSDHQ